MGADRKFKSVPDFWSHVEIQDSGCWLWTGRVGANGYGQTGRKSSAHRIAWSLENLREVPEGMLVCHHCDTPLCVNPDHLWIGTQAENVRDMKSKRRLKPAVLYGVEQKNAILNDDAVREIRRRRASGERVIDLAHAYGICPSLASMVSTGRVWRHVSDAA